MDASELRSKYIKFFVTKGHKQIPSASLIPENDPTVLFTTAGMHPLVPFLLGENHPAGRRIVNYQRCIRTGDIGLVGDDVHLTFFEMLGNWSFGDYWKEEAIVWSWEFLTEKKWLGIDPKRIYVTCFAGDNDAPRDNETAEIWKSVGIPDERIAFLGKNDNWWGPAGKTGPCGPDTEMFYQVNTDEDERPKGTNWPKGKYVEIWNDVFMQYNLPSRQAGKTADGTYEPLKQKNVDTGMGLERTLAVLNGVDSVYKTDLFIPLLQPIKEDAKEYSEQSARVIADHIKTAVFLLADGILPSNKDQGYILRRLIRKVIREVERIKLPESTIDHLVITVADIYSYAYPELFVNTIKINEEFAKEKVRFMSTVQKGLKVFQKELATLGIYGVGQYGSAIFGKGEFSGKVAFDMYQTYGFPKELINEELKQYGSKINEREWEEVEKQHQNLSRKGAEQKFAGGLADHSERVVRMHTATHLLHQALKDVLGPDVNQKGSNITAERLRFDFSFSRKVTKEELKQVEQIVNHQVERDLTVEKKILPLEEARKLGATGLFGEKYGETVSVYTIGDYSKEFCGGPHVEHTGQVGKFTILKEESVSAGVRRIKATAE